MELKSRDLRVGNTLQYHESVCMVLSILRDEKVELGYFTDSVGFVRDLNGEDAPKAIQLTEEVLLNRGSAHEEAFTYERGIDWFFSPDYNDNLDSFKIFELPGSLGTYGVINVNGFGIELKYLHELENLFFDLTKTELTKFN